MRIRFPWYAKVAANDGTVNVFARNDFHIFKQLFDYDFGPIELELGISCFSTILNYKAIVKSEQIYNKSVSEKVQELSAQIERHPERKRYTRW